VRQGHKLTLYCYSKPEDVPAGVTTADAAEIVPPDQVIAYRGGSPALFSNRFRYELQRRDVGTWIDCDVYLLRPLDGTRSILCGEQAPGLLNVSVLRIPSDSALLPPLLELFDERVVPWWLPWRARLAARIRLATTGRSGIAAMPWGTLGPYGLTAVSKALGIDLQPFPPEVLYPVPWQQAEWVNDPDTSLEAKVTAATVAIHLWNERIKHLTPEQARPGSFLARLYAEGS
jgi:hypothetical protein